jgi:hypothetical protein
MDSAERQLTQANGQWREKIEALQLLLEQTRTELIEAEAELAERLAALNRFDLRLRTRLGKLSDRLNSIQAEIQALRKQLRQMYEDWTGPDEWESEPPAGQNGGSSQDWSYREASGAGRGQERPPAEPPPTLSADQKSEIKQLFRQLARRFHPDLALDQADRAYRTDLMAAVNRAYAAGDLERLRELLLEPDAPGHLDHAGNDEQLAQSLANELSRCRRRLDEIRRDFDRLAKQKNYQLMRRAERLEGEGRDLLDELAYEVRAEIGRKLAERDALQVEVEEYERYGDRLPDAVYDLGLEEALDELVSPEFEHWLDKRRVRTEWDEDNPDYPDTYFD